MRLITQDPEREALTTAETRERVSELPQFFRRIAKYEEEFIVYDDGFRGWPWRYSEIGRLAVAFAARLRRQGIRKGDTVMIWGESRPGWIIALWGCLLEGAIAVPVEPMASLDLFRRIETKVRPRLILSGDRVPAIAASGDAAVWQLSEAERSAEYGKYAPAEVFENDIAEIVFTSGTTAEPKGVLITHRNLAAQIPPIEAQFAPYLRYVRPFAPIRILNLLPMSHLFGQSLATIIPPLIPASVLFISGTTPHEIVRQIRSRHVTILVAVPRVLEILRNFIEHRHPGARDRSHSDELWPRRWWRYRAVHRMFGWKFCCVVSGGAPLAPDLEQFWSNLGFVVVQGYGLTETAPVISFNHPFHVQSGTTGRPLAGVDVKIAEDGEVLVRGDNVTPGYFEAPQQTAAAFHDGWFYTGDLGELDDAGNLVIRGRKKDVIVTPDGLKIFPEDVEAVLDRIPGVRESAVIGKDRVRAVLVLEPGTRPDEIVRQANATLERHQKIRSVSVWPGERLPRTKTTQKLQHAEIAREIAEGVVQPAVTPGADLMSLIRKFAPGRTITPETTIEELGLSSLDRVELMMEIEEKLDTSIDESAFARVRTIGDLTKPMPAAPRTSFPAFNRRWLAKLIRGLALECILLPVTRIIARRKVSGLENLRGLRGPVIFAANHQSHLDTPIILASLPRSWRRRIAPAMWKEYFERHFHPERYSPVRRGPNSLLYFLLALFFNGFPLPQTETGARESIRYMGELVEEGWSLLIFPEGERSVTGEFGRFFPGIGMIASRLSLPVVPIRLRGVDRILPRHATVPRPGRVEVSIGPPISLQGDSWSALAQKVEEAVRKL
ncbi:MAG TPA: AMP-binding protein [Bryobacteraceae bacterium]|nr:AMP-binding protein [Bryobacteraceae bacterium]